jgi:hypothetical protein
LAHTIVGDDARIGSDQRQHAAWRRQGSGGIEPARDPFPFLAIAQKGAHGVEVADLGARRQRLAVTTLAATVMALDELADRHAVDPDDPARAGLPGPGVRPGDLGVFGGEPTAGLGEHAVVALQRRRGQR